MPKLYEYFGLRVYFYTNEHEPIHVHGRHFRIEDGDLIWGDMQMTFPIMDLYHGEI